MATATPATSPTGAQGDRPAARLVRWLPVATLVAAFAFSIHVASSIRSEVFYSGDGGVKFALTRQLARGELHVDLRLPAEPWIADLWSHGLYPFDPPFSYQIGGLRYVKDPPFFSLVTAPLFAAFGWAGLYVVPLASVWAIWLVLLEVCRRLGVGPLLASAVLAAVAFASPLTIYGAIYWEHTLAVALAFGGIALLFLPHPDDRPWRAAAGGALVALSAWFRSEHLLLVAVVAAVVLARRRGAGRAPATVGLLAPVAALFAVNLGLYGHLLGVHGLQVTAPMGASVRVANAFATLASLLRLTAEYAPIAIPAACTVVAIARSRQDREGVRDLAWTALIYVLLLPAILPRPETGGEGGKQWGPRFLLVAIPLLCVVAAAVVQGLHRIGRRNAARVAMAALAVGLVLGAWRNTWDGPRQLAEDYTSRMRPLLDFLRADRAMLIAASDQFAAQEMIALSDTKRFFFVKGPEDLERLAAAGLQHGQDRYLFLSDQVVQGAGPFALDGRGYVLRIAPLARHGLRYIAHEVRVAAISGLPGAVPGSP